MWIRSNKQKFRIQILSRYIDLSKNYLNFNKKLNNWLIFILFLYALSKFASAAV